MSDQKWKDAHKGHITLLRLLEAFDIDIDDYPYAYAHYCQNCGIYIGIDGQQLHINPQHARLEKMAKERLPKCHRCGGDMIYDGRRGCAVCKECLSDSILPLDFPL